MFPGEISFEEYSRVLQSEAAAADETMEDYTDLGGEEEVTTTEAETETPKQGG